MPLEKDEVFTAAFDLEYEDRKALAERLLETLEEKDQESVKRAWMVEVERRIQAIEDGTAKLIPAEQVFESMRREVQK